MQLANNIRGLLIDMDGVLYRGQQALAGAKELFPALDAHGIGWLLVTNNSSMSAADYSAKLAKLGSGQIDANKILTSAEATARWLADNPPIGRFYFIGGQSIGEAIERYPSAIYDDKNPQTVVVGLDSQLTYDKLKIATLAIRKGARFIATNPDVTLPTEEGLAPGAGSIVAALVAATDVQPTVIGKPNRPIMDIALKLLGVPPPNVAALGDRLNTDIAGGKAANLRTIMVLTGVSTQAEVDALPAEQRPDYVFADLPAVNEALG
jgi:4-nitrophenyl phosphatase